MLTSAVSTDRRVPLPKGNNLSTLNFRVAVIARKMRDSVPTPDGHNGSTLLRVLCVGHAMKETLSARDCRQALEDGAKGVGAQLAGSLCISDGGDGFLDAFSESFPAVPIHVQCTGPLGALIPSRFLYDEKLRTAAIESALACGLVLVAPPQRNVMESTTAGIGDLIADAIAKGATRLLVGLGGSATTDGGAGMIMRLCERLLRTPCTPPRNPENLRDTTALPLPQLRKALTGVELIGCTDVDTPLLGPNGSAEKFGPQKGATPDQVAELEATLTHWANQVEHTLGESLRDRPGAGAAGGLGFAILALGGTLQPGADMFLRLANYQQALATADVVLNCEGRFDLTSLHGKAPWKAATLAAAAGRTSAIICGSAEPAAIHAARLQGVNIIPFTEAVACEQRAQLAPQQVRDTAAAFLTTLTPRQHPNPRNEHTR